MGRDDGESRELPVDPQVLDRIASRIDRLDDVPEDGRKAALRAEAIAALTQAVATRLTPRQREIVDLYFYREKTQAEIAEELGISQQVVSKQLFGALRQGRRVGGAIRRLRVLLEERGISFEADSGKDEKGEEEKGSR